MIYILALATLFLLLSSSYSYVAYNHVQRYKYYKNVSSASLSQYVIGLLAGVPLIVLPFVTREKDKDFLKYDNIRTSVTLSRIFIILFIASIIAFIGIKFL